MIHLLDVNGLIALGDSNHPHQAPALQFFEKCATLEGWPPAYSPRTLSSVFLGLPIISMDQSQHPKQGGCLTHFGLLSGTHFGLTIFRSRFPTRLQTFPRQRNSPTSNFLHLP